jgi:ribulose-5-phosphate 4-epimerase/fuculose-1-phosphate aldolase
LLNDVNSFRSGGPAAGAKIVGLSADSVGGLGSKFNSSRREFCRASYLFGVAAATAGFAPFFGLASAAVAAPVQAVAADSADSDDQRIADLVTGNHILFDQGVVDGLGHISARCVKNPAHFWMSQSRAPGLVTKDDIMEFNEESQPVDARGRRPYGERFIHGEIYRVRPDVMSVVHSHSSAVIPFGVTGVPLQPVIHTAGFLPDATPIFEIREVEGDDNGILVHNNKAGAVLAKVLGKSTVVLMRGHGDAVVGPSVKSAVFRAIYTQLNAQIQAQALLLGQGKVVYLNSKEGANVDAVNEGGGFERIWPLWEAHAKANLAALNGSGNR